MAPAEEVMTTCRRCGEPRKKGARCRFCAAMRTRYEVRQEAAGLDTRGTNAPDYRGRRPYQQHRRGI